MISIYVLTFSCISNLKAVKKGRKIACNFRLRLETEFPGKKAEKEICKYGKKGWNSKFYMSGHPVPHCFVATSAR